MTWLLSYFLMVVIDLTEALLRGDSKRARDSGHVLQQEEFWLYVKGNTIHSIHIEVIEFWNGFH